MRFILLSVAVSLLANAFLFGALGAPTGMATNPSTTLALEFASASEVIPSSDGPCRECT
ncbi:hypothetical protein SCHPADRAFT_902586 [Schizopora paradoxa]|uniref:Uncharacterized protein n=1 Tax=Schizopora paradoxa TaxID=27342 RepID=A0A0H2S0J0_9AGAM|nr:hypothetical protein SCHPADRAFT_902586 [Schizopora paradoxa]